MSYGLSKTESKRMAEKVTPAQLRDCLIRARREITDWESPSAQNPMGSNGTIFNIFWAGWEDGAPKTVIPQIACNILRNFGKFLDGYEPPKQPSRKAAQTVARHEPPVEITTA